MPYAPPVDPSSSSSVAAVDVLSPVRPGHRRTRSSFSDERGPGAFVSLGSLPRRRPSSNPKKPLFHLNVEDESPPEGDDQVLSSPSTSPEVSTNALSLDVGASSMPNGIGNGLFGGPTNSLRLSMENGRFSPSVNPPSRIELPKGPADGVPFPKSSPLSPSDSPFIPSPPSTSSSLPRTPSTPIILSNGKPLKSSLKSSSSSPNVAGGYAGRMGKHLRAQSAPSTPRVHFAEKDAGLETVKVFHRTGKPASLSKPPGDETETETEAESYPFPSLGSSSSSSSQLIHEIDFSAGSTSSIPNPAPSPYANVHVETVTLPRTRPPTLRGTVLVRNLAFEKHVAVRFTLDDWQTTSEVTCKHVVSLPGLPPPFPRARHTVGDLVAGIAVGEREEDLEANAPSWDRFSFTIRLEDYEAKLAERTLFLVARYVPANGINGEFWDNNGGSNYRVGFRRAAPSPLAGPSRPPAFTTAYDLPPFATANQSLTDLLSSANASKGLPGLNAPLAAQHSQQRTFSAPSSLKYTPVTGALPAVVSRVAAQSEVPTFAHRPDEKAVLLHLRSQGAKGADGLSVDSSADNSEVEPESEAEKTPIEQDVDALRGAAPLLRRHSSPHPRRETPHFPMPPPIVIPRSMSQPHSPPAAGGATLSPKGPAGAYIARRLSLSNYVAPTIVKAAGGMATPPTTPPKEGAPPLPDVGAEGGKERERKEGEERKSESESDTTPTMPFVSPPLQLIGGQPATTVETLTVVRAIPPSVSPVSDSACSTCASSSTSSANDSPAPSPPPIVPVPVSIPMGRTPSLEMDEDEDKAPFSPTSRRAGKEFRISSLEAQLGLRQPQQLVSPPVSRQGSEDGSGQSSPASGSGRNSPGGRASPPRRGSPSRLDLPDLSAVFVRDIERVRTSPGPSTPDIQQQQQGLVQPEGAGRVDTSDSSYAAFVRQWCFAQSAPPTPGVINASPGPSASPVPTPSPPIPSSVTSLGGVGSFSGLGLGMGVPAAAAAAAGSAVGVANMGVGPRRQMAWPAEHQVGLGSNMGLGSGYGFPGFGFATGRHAAVAGTHAMVAEGMVGGKHLSPAFAAPWAGGADGVAGSGSGSGIAV